MGKSFHGLPDVASQYRRQITRGLRGKSPGRGCALYTHLK